ncbi:uncharacterized protein PSFLO_03666 [Pseudozyma flocculosa]|uniref:Uncharacterized protein n=1 Tax=Pseudozyma flocculosa TaxID=84751 RepID=A0A5C3F412_9BASI|nr:uncharacterized protein PSFLO_03666 [Pseudozyma flocculosa]
MAQGRSSSSSTITATFTTTTTTTTFGAPNTQGSTAADRLMPILPPTAETDKHLLACLRARFSVPPQDRGSRFDAFPVSKRREEDRASPSSPDAPKGWRKLISTTRSREGVERERLTRLPEHRCAPRKHPGSGRAAPRARLMPPLVGENNTETRQKASASSDSKRAEAGAYTYIAKRSRPALRDPIGKVSPGQSLPGLPASFLHHRYGSRPAQQRQTSALSIGPASLARLAGLTGGPRMAMEIPRPAQQVAPVASSMGCEEAWDLSGQRAVLETGCLVGVDRPSTRQEIAGACLPACSRGSLKSIMDDQDRALASPDQTETGLDEQEPRKAANKMAQEARSCPTRTTRWSTGGDHHVSTPSPESRLTDHLLLVDKGMVPSFAL